MRAEKKLIVVFYRSRTGAEPVRDWLKGLPVEDRQALGRDLRLVELGYSLWVCRFAGL